MDYIKPLVVFIGESASGKSTLMKVIALMRYIFKMLNIRAYLKNANISKSPFRLRFDSLLQDGLEKYFMADTEISYSVETNGHTYKIEYKQKKLNANINIDKGDLMFFKESFISETRSAIPTWASKAASNKGAELGYYFHETYSDFNDATDVVKNQSLDYLNLNMKIQKSGNKPKRFMIEPSGDDYQPVELKYASSGIQTSVPLLTIVRYFSHEFSFKDAFQRSVLTYLYEQDRLSQFKPDIELGELDKYVHIHIEEPELSLYPSSQRLLMNEIVKEAFHTNEADRKLGVMIATHSPYIINHLNILLRAGYYDNARKTYPYLKQDDMDAYKIEDGRLIPLMSTDNESGQYVINTLDLSDSMEQIYNDYINIKD